MEDFLMSSLKVLILGLVLPALMSPAQQVSQHRPPAVPLITNDPYFSVWSMSDQLTATPTKHWSEAPQPMTGLIRIDGHPYRWMGAQPRWPRGLPDIPAMRQDSLQVTPLHTRYSFSASGVELQVTFFTPLFPQDLDVMSRPVTYLTWSARSTDGANHTVDLLLDVGPEMAVNENGQRVTWGRSRVKGMTVLNIGSQEQANLHQSGDRIRIDWGYFRLCIPDDQQAATEISNEAIQHFVHDGAPDAMDDLEMPRAAVSSRGPAAHL